VPWWGWGWGWGYPGYYAGYPWYYGDGYYDDPSYQSYSGGGYSNDYYAPVSPQEQQRQDEIDRMNDQKARQRQQESSPNQPQAKAASHAKTVLVFQDKHSEEVQNYAIVGQTLWVFDEQQAKKIRITDLDVPATKKANEDRGVDFQLPSGGTSGQATPQGTEAQPSRTDMIAPGIA
jgi:hypothetical protein